MKLDELVVLTEFPQLAKVDSDYLKDRTLNIIQSNVNLIKPIGMQKMDVSNHPLFITSMDKAHYIYFYADKNDDGSYYVYAAVQGIIEEHIGIKMFRTAVTIKNDKKFEQAALKLYSYVSQNTNSKYLISDEIHSIASMKNWQKWLKNPGSFGISEIFLYDTQDKKRLETPDNLMPYWCESTECQRYRIIVKF